MGLTEELVLEVGDDPAVEKRKDLTMQAIDKYLEDVLQGWEARGAIQNQGYP